MTTYRPSTTLANKAIELTALRAPAHSQRWAAKEWQR
jgi:hypothetical protein